MIGIIGYGVIGKTTHQVLFPIENVKIHDVIMNTNISDLFGSELVFVCIPTNNHSDILEIKNIIKTFQNQSPETEIVIRSTIIPGFFNEITGNVTYFPEFLRERNAINDAKNVEVLFYASNLQKSRLHDYDEFNFKLKRIKFSELEILKLMSNNYYAMKVVFANHYYDICKKYNADYDVLLHSFRQTKNGQSYMEVNENLRGYGGKCLPKDMDFSIDIFNNCKLFQSIKEDNQKWEITVREDI
jgi:UDPglucose 6-dehydrogenase